MKPAPHRRPVWLDRLRERVRRRELAMLQPGGLVYVSADDLVNFEDCKITKLWPQSLFYGYAPRGPMLEWVPIEQLRYEDIWTRIGDLMRRVRSWL